MPKKEFEPGRKYRRIKGVLDDPRPILTKIGVIMVAESQEAFVKQQFGEDVWRPRRVPNLFGILNDIANNKTPPKRRFDARPALKDTGDMARKIDKRLIGNFVVEVGSNQPYAALMHHGGTSKSVVLSDRVRAALWAWLKKGGRKYRKELGWVLNRKFRGKQLTAEIPPRPFVGLTRQTIADVHEIVGVTIREA